MSEDSGLRIHMRDSLWSYSDNLYQAKNSTVPSQVQTVEDLGDKVRIHTDAVGSIPVFFLTQDGVTFVSDNPYWICEQIDVQLDEDALIEYFNLKNPLGRKTWIRNLLRTLPGENLTINLHDGTIKSHRYVEFRKENLMQRSQDINKELVRQSLEDSFSKAFSSVKGKIVIPLSGGFDSRIIATLAVKLGYRDRVLAYSFGPEGNSEAEVAQEVSDQLGIRFEFIQYTPEKIKELVRQKKFLDFVKSSSQLFATPHIMDFFAIQELTDSGKLKPGDAVFPGHSGDFTSGSRLTKIEKICRSDTIEAVYQYHRIRPHHSISLRTSISEVIGNRKGTDAFEFFDWQERQCKYIVQSLRTYEFFGLSWRLPMFDEQQLKLWNSIPQEQRRNQKLYKHVLRQQFEEQGVTTQEATAGNSHFKQLLLTILKSSPAWLLLSAVNIHFTLSTSFRHQEAPSPILAQIYDVSFRNDIPEPIKKLGAGHIGRDRTAIANDFAFWYLSSEGNLHDT